MRAWYTGILKQNDPALRAEVRRAVLEEQGPRPQDLIGSVVEFLRGGRHLCGVVQPAPYGRRVLWVLDQEGRETWVKRRKVMDLSREKLGPQPREALVRALRQIDAQREEMKRGLEMRALWETAAESGQEAWTLDELTALYFGALPGRDGRAALARALDEGHWFARQEEVFVPRPAAAVALRDQAVAQQQRAAQQLEEVATWLRRAADGQPAERPALAAAAIALLEEAALLGAESQRAAEAARLMHKAHLHGAQAAFQVLVKLGHWDPDENLELRRYQVPSEFSAEALAEAGAAHWRPEACQARRWWGRQVCGFSRDGEGCDQAFSVRRTLFGYRVGIHCAAPALVLEPSGQIQDEAAARGLSLRLPDDEIPLLPPRIAELTRFTAVQRRPALSLEVRFDRRWQMQGWAIRLSRVRPRRVWRWAEARPEENRLLQRLHELALALREKRRARGALILPEPFPDLEVQEGKVVLKDVEEGSPARLIHGELTLLAGALAGAFCAREGIPAIYRLEELPAERLIAGDETDPVRVHQQRKRLSRPILQTRPAPAARRGLEYYVPIAQPLEGYPDLLMQQQLVHWIARGTALYTPADLERGLADSAWAREVAGRITASRQRYFQLKYLEGRVGEEMEAVVLERIGAGCLVELRPCRLKAFLPPEREAWTAPGDQIRVQIAEVSARRDLIHLARPRGTR